MKVGADDVNWAVQEEHPFDVVELVAIDKNESDLYRLVEIVQVFQVDSQERWEHVSNSQVSDHDLLDIEQKRYHHACIGLCTCKSHYGHHNCVTNIHDNRLEKVYFCLNRALNIAQNCKYQADHLGRQKEPVNYLKILSKFLIQNLSEAWVFDVHRVVVQV